MSLRWVWVGLLSVSITGCATAVRENQRFAFVDADTYDNGLLTLPETSKTVAFEAREPSTPEEAFAILAEGNDRFVRGAMEHRNQNETRRRALAGVQKPFAIVLSCSDSRVPPELVFDQGLGDLFVIRVAGNILGSAQVASIEYAIEHLGSKLVVVLGHESCGAVKAAIQTPYGQNAGSTDLNWLLSEIRPNVSVATDTTRLPASLREFADPKFRKPVMANVDIVTESLIKRSAIVRHAMHEGKLQFVRAIYGLESGKVDFWGFGEKFKGVSATPALLGGHTDAVPEEGHRTPASH